MLSHGMPNLSLPPDGQNRSESLSVAARSVRGVNLREQAVYKTDHDMWTQTGRPVSADAIAQATGFDDQTTQQILKGLDAKGYFVDALRGDDRIDSITYA